MKYRKLGRTNLELSEIGYGAWGIGGKQWLGNDDDESLKALHHSFDLGLNFIDTALAYGDGHSEGLVGKAVRDAGKEIYIATKIPPKDQVWPASPQTPIDEVFPYDYIVRCTEESLCNLNREQIDLQQFHVWTDAWTETGQLVKLGRVRVHVANSPFTGGAAFRQILRPGDGVIEIRGAASARALIWVDAKAEYFCRKGWTGFG